MGKYVSVTHCIDINQSITVLISVNQSVPSKKLVDQSIKQYAVINMINQLTVQLVTTNTDHKYCIKLHGT